LGSAQRVHRLPSTSFPFDRPGARASTAHRVTEGLLLDHLPSGQLLPRGFLRELSVPTRCCQSLVPTGCQLSSGSGRSRPHPELTVSATLLTSTGTDNRGPDDGFQGSADVARSPARCNAFLTGHLNRRRGPLECPLLKSTNWNSRPMAGCRCRLPMDRSATVAVLRVRRLD
jgi:hypothetical protein